MLSVIIWTLFVLAWLVFAVGLCLYTAQWEKQKRINADRHLNERLINLIGMQEKFRKDYKTYKERENAGKTKNSKY